MIPEFIINNLFNNEDSITKIIPKIQRNREVLDYLKNKTEFLPEKASISQRLYHIKNDIENCPICKICSAPVSFDGFYKGYKTYCSNKCVMSDPDFYKRAQATFIKNYGNNYSSIDKKRKQTCINKYGVDHPCKSKDVILKTKNTCLLKYGVESVNQLEKTKSKRKLSYLFHYGVDHPSKVKELQEKRKQTCVNKYGADHPNKSKDGRQKLKDSLSSIITKESTIASSINRYGVSHYSKTEEFKQRISSTCLIKYGTTNTLTAEEVKSKIKLTNLERYGKTNPSGVKEVNERRKNTLYKKAFNTLILSNKLDGIIPLFTEQDYTGTKNTIYKFRCVKCTSVFTDSIMNGRIPTCRVCNPYNISLAEINLHSMIKDLKVEFLQRDRNSIKPYELDFYLPDHKVAIEFNGLYWHSELSGKDKNYHLNKTKLCNEKEVQLIHIFEDEWRYKQNIVKSIIKNKLGVVDTKIYARKCIIKEVSQEDSYNFLFNNHLQEPIYSNYNFGLYYNNELVQLITLSKPRFNKKYQFELIRSCSKINTQVIGGFDRLIKYAIRTLDIKSLISYVDRRYFNGSGYKNNWKFINETKPNYFYINKKGFLVRESRIKYQKHKLKKLFPKHYDDRLTEWQIMQLAGYDRIWDCGSLVYEYKISY